MNIGIGALWEKFAHRNIRECLLGSVGVGRCPCLRNRSTFGLVNQLVRRYTPATKLELIRFWSLPLGEIVWHHSTQVNNSYLAAHINVSDLRRSKRRHFIHFMVYALVYPGISSNLVTLATISPRYESMFTHTCYTLLRKPLLRLQMKVETRLLINLYQALNSFGS